MSSYQKFKTLKTFSIAHFFSNLYLKLILHINTFGCSLQIVIFCMDIGWDTHQLQCYINFTYFGFNLTLWTFKACQKSHVIEWVHVKKFKHSKHSLWRISSLICIWSSFFTSTLLDARFKWSSFVWKLDGPPAGFSAAKTFFH
jgi:hypothetical protein